MLRSIRYFYYFLYVGRLKAWKNENMAQWTSGIIVLALFTINIFTIPILIDDVFNIWILPKDFPKEGIWTPICLIILIALFHWILNKLIFSKYLSIKQEFELLPKSKKNVYNIVSYLYILSTFLAFMLLGNYNIYKGKQEEKYRGLPQKVIIDPLQDSIKRAEMDSTVNQYRKNGS